METKRKILNKQVTELRRVMESFSDHEKAIQMFLDVHAQLHSAQISQTNLWSFEDAVLDDLPEEIWRRIPQNCEHSIAWCIWHIARIEDMTMNLLVAGTPQLFLRDGWMKRLRINDRSSGNAMDITAVEKLSNAIDVEALREYRTTVGRRTREIVRQLQPEDLKQKTDPARLQKVLDEGAVVEEAIGVVEYWGKRTIAGLLLMPPTRHCLVHLNETLTLKNRRK